MDHTYIPAFTLEPEKRAAAPAHEAGSAARTPRFIDDVAAGRVELPTIPRVVQRLIAALRDPDIDFRKIGEALSQDPVLSAKVLRMANSSFFGGQRSMASIDNAVALVGVQALTRVVMACGVSASFDAVPGIDLRLFWREALVAATAANKLAPICAADPEEAYVCGLLHAAGHLILCRSYPEIADAMFTGFAPVRGAELAAIEMESFGIDHAQVGAIWVDSLGFPKSVSEAIGKSLRSLAELTDTLDLALHSGCQLAAAVTRDEAAETALGALPPSVHAKWVDTSGQPNAAFARLYDQLREVEPAL